MKKIVYPLLLISFCMVYFTSCKKDPVVSIPTPYSIALVSGNAQTDTVNNQLAQALVVLIKDSSGAGLEGVEVTFSIVKGAGSLTQSTVTSDADGFAESYWTLGSVTLQNEVTATASVRLGSPVTFNADALSRTFTDARDGREYRTLRVGDQEWMADNLHFNAPGSFVNPANPSATYGRLYYWPTLMNGSASSNAVPSGVQGICPSGWHLPSDEEWVVLERSWDFPEGVMYDNAWRGPGAAEMKSDYGWPPADSTANNAFGWNGFPAGFYGNPVQGACCTFQSLGTATDYWTTTEEDATRSIVRKLSQNYEWGVGRYPAAKDFARSCRCVKD